MERESEGDAEIRREDPERVDEAARMDESLPVGESARMEHSDRVDGSVPVENGRREASTSEGRGPLDQAPREGVEVTRREFLEGTGAALVAAGAVPGVRRADLAETDLGADDASMGSPAEQEALAAAPRTSIRLIVNGTEHSLDVEDRWTLNELLRDQLQLTGSKIGCNRGECGACTVLLDGDPVYSCSTLAVWADGRSVVTVEGLERDGEVSALQQAFMDHNAPQCGFCTPGQLMAATALLASNPRPTEDEVREALVGNLCRCSNYNAIVEAVLAAAGGSGAGGAL